MLPTIFRTDKVTTKFSLAGLAMCAFAAFSSPAAAEATFSVFGGANFSPHSSTTWDLGPGANVAPGREGIGWDGDSFSLPPYYGFRATWWLEDTPQWGVAAEFTHSKVVADPAPAGFSRLEMTDGINIVTVNALHRWQMENGLVPYVGAGVGLSIPHVEVDDGAGGAPTTMEYQITGAAVQAFAGVSYEFTENWSLYGELKSTYAQVDADLENNGSLETNIISNQIIVGLTYRFW